jgi:hypothetical protein
MALLMVLLIPALISNSIGNPASLSGGPTIREERDEKMRLGKWQNNKTKNEKYLSGIV